MLDIQPAEEISNVSWDFYRSCQFIHFLQHQNWQT